MKIATAAEGDEKEKNEKNQEDTDSESLEKRIRTLEACSKLARLNMIKMFEAGRCGALAGSFSIVDLYVGMYFDFIERHLEKELGARHLYQMGTIEKPTIIPKGTSALGMYGVLATHGLIDEELIKHYGTPNFPPILHRFWPGIDETAYTLGVSFGTAVGFGLAEKLKGSNKPVICYIGDGEVQEGVEMAAKYAAKVNLDNLCLVIERNGLQSFFPVTYADPTMELDEKGNLSRQRKIWEAYGWDVKEIDGHNFSEILAAYDFIGKSGKPLLILAKTVKGKGVEFMENNLNYTHRLETEELKKAKGILEKSAEGINPYGYAFRYTNFAAHVKLKEKENTIEPKIPKTIEDKTKSIEENFWQWLAEFISINKGKAYSVNADSVRAIGLKPGAKMYGTDNLDCPHIFPGLNEPFTFNVAKGMSQKGLYPIICEPAPTIYNARDAWRGICMDRSKVLVIGTKPGLGLQDWGFTHTVFEDIEFMRDPNCQVFQPCSGDELLMILNGIYKKPDKYLPAYLRLPLKNSGIKIPVGRMEEVWRDGFYVAKSGLARNKMDNFAAILTSGNSINLSLEAAKLLQEREEQKIVPYKVISIFNLSEINKESLNREIAGCSSLVSVIEATAGSMLDMVFPNLSPEMKAIYTAFGIKSGCYGKEADVLRMNNTQASDIAETLIRGYQHKQQNMRIF